MMELKDFVKQGKESAFKDFTEQEIESIQNIKSVKGKVVAILKHIYDPEISVNIWDLGLIYGVDIVNNNLINIKMTLTSATCLVADSILFEILTLVVKRRTATYLFLKY